MFDTSVATTADPPPNCEKLKVTPPALIVSVLLSPVPLSFQVAVTVSPALNAPSAPVAPDTLMFPAVTIGCSSSKVALFPLVVVALPAWSAAVTATWAVVVSMLPAVTV